MSIEKSADVLQNVRDRYAGVASSELSNDANEVRAVAAAFGYSDEELASLPAEANMGLSCGNPVALASLRAGETVVDLGCGGGLDVILASKQVGPTGTAIGIDMTAEMLDRARAGAAKVGATNVQFHLATIDSLPLEDDSVDCIISNCVINLAPDKAAVFREMLRVLKPGGRLAISDIALKKPLPPEVKENIDAYVGCISGAILIDEYREGLQSAGFSATTVTGTGADLNAYAKVGESGCCAGDSADSSGCCAQTNSEQGTLHAQLTEVLSQFDANDYAASVRVHAVKSANGNESVVDRGPANRHIKIYDRAMCCSTGVCGPQVDPVLPRFAADLDWLKSQGHSVTRFNLSQDPAEYASDEVVKKMLADEGVDCLPLVIVDDRVVSRSEYPSRENLALWTGTVIEKVASLPLRDSGGCCGDTGCC